jgi:hypothetical protein
MPGTGDCAEREGIRSGDESVAKAAARHRTLKGNAMARERTCAPKRVFGYGDGFPENLQGGGSFYSGTKGLSAVFGAG